MGNLADLIGFFFFIQLLCGLIFRILLIFTRLFGRSGRGRYVIHIFDADAALIFVVRRRGRRQCGCCRLRCCLRRRLLCRTINI